MQTQEPSFCEHCSPAGHVMPAHRSTTQLPVTGSGTPVMHTHEPLLGEHCFPAGQVTVAQGSTIGHFPAESREAPSTQTQSPFWHTSPAGH